MTAQDDGILSLQTALMNLDTFLREVIKALKENERDALDSRPLFKNSVAKNSRQISIYLKDDGEQYGMNLETYEALMNHSKRNRIVFKNLLASGNFHFEGKNTYFTKMIVITVGNNRDIHDSHIPLSLLPEAPIAIDVECKKRKVSRGPGVKNYKSARTAVVNSKKLTEDLVRVIDESLLEYNEIKKKTIATASIKFLWKLYNKEEEISIDKNAINAKIVASLKEYISGIMKSGGRYDQIGSTIDTVLTAISVKESNNTIMAEVLGMTTRRLAKAKVNRKEVDRLILEGDKKNKSTSESDQIIDDSSCYSTDIDQYYADYGSGASNDGRCDYSTSGSETESVSIGLSPPEVLTEKKKKFNIFFNALSPKARKPRTDKLDLNVVRDFCHETCRLDTFASAKIFVHNYDGSHSYHQIHMRSQSLKEHYKIFQNSTTYHQWQNENKRECNKKYKLEPFIYPTIKFRSFTNAFCPCCLNQKQRDCANHVQVNLNNALKALGNIRRFQSKSNTIKSCTCIAHKNENYMRCPTSLTYFKDAVMCARTAYPDLSENKDFKMTIENMEKKNIDAELEKKKTQKLSSENVNRNIKREGAARQTDKIQLVNWGPMFTCHSKECAYQQCSECGVKKFFSDDSLCAAERNSDVQVLVRKYENVLGRSRGMQLEIVETKMNGDELIEHLINCAVLAMPHEWNVTWNAQARTVCVNTSLPGALHLMTDFSAVLDHDVQDKLNTAIPCRSNQCIFLATHSPRLVRLENEVEKRIQENEVWHFWSGQGGVLEANSYYHSVCTRHILKEYRTLELNRVNIFTDGCAEQYKSRRNAYFVAALAEENNITVTHNFAPTASFKTMVDGQGNVTKALYRRLERSEEEGTRCPTSYDLFKLFTSKYELIPGVVENSKKNPMTIIGRRHRFLVDAADATPEMVQRSIHQRDVIITNYIDERWDAPPIKNIKTIYSLIAKCEEGKVRFRSRPHACFCDGCIQGHFEECLHGDISGPLRDETFLKLPFKEKIVRKDCLTDESRRLQFFQGPLAINSETPIIVAIPRQKKDVSDEAFVFGIMTKKVKELSKDMQCEYTIDSLINRAIVKKGTLCVTVKLLTCKNVIENEYYIPLKTSEMKVPIVILYIPAEEANAKREDYIKCKMQTELHVTGQVFNTYIIDCNSMDDVRLSINGS